MPIEYGHNIGNWGSLSTLLEPQCSYGFHCSVLISINRTTIFTRTLSCKCTGDALLIYHSIVQYIQGIISINKGSLMQVYLYIDLSMHI